MEHAGDTHTHGYVGKTFLLSFIFLLKSQGHPLQAEDSAEGLAKKLKEGGSGPWVLTVPIAIRWEKSR